MGFVESIKTCFSKYATFSGRATRSEFWWFALFLTILGFVASIVDEVLGTQFDLGFDPYTGATNNPMGYGKVAALAYLGMLLPYYAVLTRRLHDTGRSGWNFLWVFTIVGAFFLLYWLCKASDGGNAYGSPSAEIAGVSAQTEKGDPLTEIERFGSMLERGLITPEEFAEQKQRLLSQM